MKIMLSSRPRSRDLKYSDVRSRITCGMTCFFCALVCVFFSSCTDSDFVKSEKAFDEQFEVDRLKENFVVDMCHATLGGVPVRLEVADDEQERQKGLSFRASMPDDHGMIFIFDESRKLTFWMKDTYMDLDIAFLDEEGVIVDIQQMKRDTYTVHESRAEALYAVEMNAGWCLRHNVGKGAKLDIKAIKERLYDEYVDGYIKRS